MQVAADGKMCIMSLDVKRSVAMNVPNALKVLLAPGAGLAQAVRAGLPPTTKEPQVQQAIQAATAEAERARVSPCVSVHFQLELCRCKHCMKLNGDIAAATACMNISWPYSVFSLHFAR